MTQMNYERHFVPRGADMGDWAQLEPLFDKLEQRSLNNTDDLQQWLLDTSELSACISEESSKRHVAMTCATDDPQKEQAYLYFVEEITPKCKPRWQTLRERYVASPARSKLPQPRFTVYDRSTTAAVEIFREENVPLQVEEDKLDQQYQKICGGMTVQFDGKERTLQQMSRYLREPDRALRQQAWEQIVQRRLQDRDAIDEIFDKQLELRGQIARNAGFDNFRDYQFRVYERFDYAPADCLQFHRAIQTVAAPAARKIQEERRESLKVDPLRPWDLAVDPFNRPPLKPFETADQLCKGSSAIFHRIDPELGRQFDEMIQKGWLDLESRKGKAPGGYQATFDEQRRPFIFMNAVGLHGDVETLLHEGGHAFHAVACRDEPLVQYRHCGMEMAEVASMGMELLAYDHLDVFYKSDDLKRARREQMESIIGLFSWIATIDAFQHWLYTGESQWLDDACLAPSRATGNAGGSSAGGDSAPALGVARDTAKHRVARTAAWLRLMDLYGGIEDWTGYENSREALWQRQLHLFGVPFYYIEYGIAQIGALQLWQNARKDKVQALRQYREALKLGGSRPLPELWQAAGLTFDFSQKTLEPLIRAVSDELARL